MIGGDRGSLAGRGWREALIATYSFRCVAALLLALPIVSAAHASGVTQFPESDRLLFEPGGALLSEVLVSQRAALLAAVSPTLATLAVLAVLALGPELLLLRAATLSQRSELASALQERPHGTRRLFQRLLTLGAVTVLSRALLVGLSLGLAFSARSWFASARDPRLPDAVFLAVLALGALAQLALSTLRDLAAAAMVARGLRLADSIVAALHELRPRACGAYTAAFGAGIALMLLGALVVSAVDVSQPGAWRALFVFAVHQAVVLGSIAARALWLSSAVRRVVGASA